MNPDIELELEKAISRAETAESEVNKLKAIIENYGGIDYIDTANLRALKLAKKLKGFRMTNRSLKILLKSCIKNNTSLVKKLNLVKKDLVDKKAGSEILEIRFNRIG